MGDGYRAAGFNLFSEQRHHTAIAAQYIAKPYRSKFCTGDLGKALDNQLTDAFGGTHHIGRAYCLISGNQYHFFHMVPICRLCHNPCAQHIIFYGFIRTVLHQRHMLMCCRMEYQLRMIGFKNGVNPLLIAHGTDQYLQIQFRILLHQLAPNLIGIIFIYIQDNEFFGVMYCQLPADFTANRAASAGDQNHLAGYIIHNFVHAELNRLTFQKILNLHLAQHGHTDFSVDNLVQSRQRHHPAGCIAADFQNPFALCTGNRWHCHNDLPYMILFCQHGNLCNRACNRHAVEIFAYLGQVIIHQAYYLPADTLAADDL